MYPPPHHQSHRKEHMMAVAEACPFGTLVTARNDTPFITHLPVLLNRTEERLIAHIDRQNPQCDTLKRGAQATVVFKGPDTYISPSVYGTSQLPTWNYIIVHVTGTIEPITASNAVKDSMVQMTSFLEGDTPAFRLEKEDPRMDRLVPYILAFEITDLKWEGKFKLSQDKSVDDKNRAKSALLEESTGSWHSLIEKIYTEFM
ncbi:MAG: transcriptional regulator [Flavobacteriaceae bacterium]|nr:transcriptional regulator [Flavobacteriaceae bacterium]|tara:strand:+ start:4775 stop:5380 length:606 start_codon:yes stop_codon:yes gene_type:complete